MPYLLEMKNITKTFGSVKAIDNVSLRLNAGEIVSLCGENGSGKSTLMKVLCGIYPHGSYEGEIIFAGEEIQASHIRDTERKGIAIIHQELALVKELTGRLVGVRLPEDAVPRCPDCGRVLVPWVRDDTFLEGSAWKAQVDRYHAFLRRWLLEQSGKNVLLLELGVGEMTPSIIKLPFWELTARNENVFYACLNRETSHAPEHLRERSLYLQGDLVEILPAIRRERPNANTKSEGANEHN